MFNFLKYRWLYFFISGLVIGAGLLSITVWGFKYSIDFAGGTNLTYQVSFDLKPVNEKEIQDLFNNELVEIVQLKTTGRIIEVRTKAIDEKKAELLRQDIEKRFGTVTTALRVETVGPVLGKETMVKTITAAIIAIIGILLYMSFAFKGFDFAIAAILAMLHDFLVVVGVYAILSHFYNAEVDTLFVTAVLTAMSFSVHDTIIIFDKIREYQKTEGIDNFTHAINRALAETLVRSLNNSATIIFMLLALVLFGGTTIKFFVLTLLVGTITGAYSSPFIATPLLYLFKQQKLKK